MAAGLSWWLCHEEHQASYFHADFGPSLPATAQLFSPGACRFILGEASEDGPERVRGRHFGLDQPRKSRSADCKLAASMMLARLPVPGLRQSAS